MATTPTPDAAASATGPTALSAPGGLALLAAACLTIMVGCVLAPALPEIAAGLHLHGNASWLITLPSLGVVLSAPLAGRLILRLGAHRALWAGCFGYGLLGLLGAVLPGTVPVLLDRLLLGGATALVMASGTTLISQFHEGEARLRMIARQGMAIELGGVVFLFVGGLLAAWSWRAPFLLYATAWAVGLAVLALVPRAGPAAAPVPAAEPGGAASWRRHAEVLAAAALSMAVFFTAVIALPPALARRGIGAAGSGQWLAFVSLVAVGFAFLMPRATARLGGRLTLAVAFLAFMAAHLLFRHGGGLPVRLAGTIALGAGFGLSIPLVNHMTIERSPPSRRGADLATLAMAIFLGQFLASFVTASGAAGGAPGGAATGGAFVAAALLSAVAAAAFLWRGRRSGPG